MTGFFVLYMCARVTLKLTRPFMIVHLFGFPWLLFLVRLHECVS